ncbi:hypothetical protein FRC02_011586 [Tulasnella sp. 418]|nr:hypothetical protein FRC02_011586 [Tulasnella sp. 418]
MQHNIHHLRNATYRIINHNSFTLRPFLRLYSHSLVSELSKAVITPTSTDALQKVQRRARDLSNRHDELSDSIRRRSRTLVKATEIANNVDPNGVGHILSPQGQANPKSVDAASKLKEAQKSSKELQEGVSTVKPEELKGLARIGLRMPTKPEPPGPEDCCMSGCAVCVQDLYVESLRDYKFALKRIRDKLVEGKIGKDEWPEVILSAEGRAEKPQNADDEFEGMDPSMKAFMMMEKQLKQNAVSG